MKKTLRLFAAFLAVLTIMGSLFGFLTAADGIYTPVNEPAADAVYAVNDDTGLVMYAKNENEKMYPASLTKIMAALVILQNTADLDGTKATMTSDLVAKLYNTDSSNIGMVAGETFTMRQILYAMMLRSAGDAALLAAQTVSGSVDAFVTAMNDTAAQLGCTGTHFTSPHGLHDENHYSTARDMYVIAAKAMEDPIFAEVVRSTSYTIPATEKKDARTIYTTNNMMLSSKSVYYKSVCGIKTGFTTPAGPCIAARAISGGVSYTLIVLHSNLTNEDGSTDRDGAMKIAKELFNWLFGDFELKAAFRKGDSVNCSIKVNYGKDTDSVAVVVGEDYITMLPKNSEGANISYVIPAAVDAPVQAGQVLVDDAVVIIGGQELTKKVTLVTAAAVEKSEIAYIFAQIGEFFSSGLMIAIVIILLVLIVGYIVLNILYNRKKKRRYSASGSGKKRRTKTTKIFR